MSQTLADLKRAYYLAQATGALVTDSLADLEYKFFSNPPSFDFSKTSNILNIPETFTQINSLQKYLSPGHYVVNVAATWRFTANNGSALFRISNDGGTTWGEIYSIDPPAGTDLQPFSYSYPKYFPGGDVDIVLESRKTVAGGSLDVTFCDIWFEQVPNPV
jgi:hypothetical protein